MSTDVQRQLVAIRRELHRIPELSFHERETNRYVKAVVERYATVRDVAKTGFWADLGPEDAELTLLLRADMDGLPIQEENAFEHRSTHAGRMHACGHDAHMAALSVAGRLLSQATPFGLRVRLLFQPAEEGGGGALACIEGGALEGVDAAFGIHVWNELPIGSVALTPGGIMASVVEVGFRVCGEGGHGALPHRTIDPIVAASQLVMALQTVASRRTSPVEPVVVSIGAFQAGEAFNVIPAEARLVGTVRAFSHEVQANVEAQIRAIAAGVATATGTRIDVDWHAYTAPTVNDAGMSELVARAVDRMVGLERVLTDYRTMAGEDFGEIAKVVPACFALVGSRNEDKGLTEPHHSPRFEIDEDVLGLSCDLHRAVAAEFAESGEAIRR